MLAKELILFSSELRKPVPWLIKCQVTIDLILMRAVKSMCLGKCSYFKLFAVVVDTILLSWPNVIDDLFNFVLMYRDKI